MTVSLRVELPFHAVYLIFTVYFHVLPAYRAPSKEQQNTSALETQTSALGSFALKGRLTPQYTYYINVLSDPMVG